MRTEARTSDVTVAIVIDFIHVLEYLWKSPWCFHQEGDPAAETWVRTHANSRPRRKGHPRRRHHPTRRHHGRTGPNPPRRRRHLRPYLTNKHPYLDYPTALHAGWPIATGVIEGACHHLVKDRMDLTGARWGLPAAEAILNLRALHSNGDWNAYWTYHLQGPGIVGL